MSSATIAAPPGFRARIVLFYFGFFTFGGVSVPFFPVWLEGRGLTEIEIANCVALPALLRVLLTPFAGFFADRAPNRRFAAMAFVIPAALIFLLAWRAQNYLQILIVTAIAFTTWSLALPVVEALALTGVRRFGLDYGRMRVSGSIAFIVANLGSGALLSLLYPEAIFWIIAGTLFFSAVVATTLPVTPPELRKLDDATRPESRPTWRILSQPGFLVLILVGALIQASHAVLYSFGSIHWRALGFDGVEIGAFWATGIVVEVTLFFLSSRAVQAFGPLGLLAFGGIAAVIRWTLAAQDPGFLGFLALQALHGLTFGAVYLGNQHAIARAVPDRMTALAQGILAMVSGLALAGATALAGPLYAHFGAEAYLFMTLFPAVALAILATYRVFARIGTPA